MFFADLNHTAEIVNPGLGMSATPFDGNSSVRISGKGYRPQQWELIASERIGSTDYNYVVTNFAEYWGQDKDGNYTFEPYVIENSNVYGWSALPGHGRPDETEIIPFPLGTNRETWDYRNNPDLIPTTIFSDWQHQPNIGEPRLVGLDFNQSLSHVTLDNPGFGYSMPVEIDLIRGFPLKEELEDWVAQNQTSYQFIPAEFRVDTVDENGSIQEPFVMINSGVGYIQEPTVVIRGGGGVGATARAVLEANGSIARLELTSGGRGYFNIDPSNKPTASLVHDLVVDPWGGNEVDANLTVRLEDIWEKLEDAQLAKVMTMQTQQALIIIIITQMHGLKYGIATDRRKRLMKTRIEHWQPQKFVMG